MGFFNWLFDNREYSNGITEIPLKGYQPKGLDEAKNPPTGGSNVIPSIDKFKKLEERVKVLEKLYSKKIKSKR